MVSPFPLLQNSEQRSVKSETDDFLHFLHTLLMHFDKSTLLNFTKIAKVVEKQNKATAKANKQSTKRILSK